MAPAPESPLPAAQTPNSIPAIPEADAPVHPIADVSQTLERALLNEIDDAEDEAEEDAEEIVNKLTHRQIVRRSCILLLGGTVIIALFSDPLVDAISGFAASTGIPTFFVAFIITPFASNSSEVISSLIFAARMKKKNISLTYSQIYGAVTMNNTMCLGIFMALMALRGLEWHFSSEVVVIILTTWIIGIMVALKSSRTLRLWVAIPVLAMYPVSLVIVWLLDHMLGWQ